MRNTFNTISKPMPKTQPIQGRLTPEEIRAIDDHVKKIGNGATRAGFVTGVLRQWFISRGIMKSASRGKLKR